MNTKKNWTVWIMVLAFVAFGSAAWAAKGMQMMAGKANPKAHATLTLTKTSLGIEARGLKPNSVFSVWLVNMTPKETMAGVGSPPYSFKSDSHGKCTYKASLSEPPFGKWQMVMVMLHPTGDPKDMENMVDALSAKVPDAR